MVGFQDVAAGALWYAKLYSVTGGGRVTGVGS